MFNKHVYTNKGLFVSIFEVFLLAHFRSQPKKVQNLIAL